MKAVADAYTVAPLTPMRRAIAARMSEAKRSIPHFRLVADVQFDALMAQRKALRDQRPDQPVSLNDFLIKACSQALVEVPDLNVQWAEKELHRYHRVDISVVTAVQGGLSTPILRAADRKSVWQIASEIRELTARAARNALKMDEIVGGTFSLSNLGMYDVDQFDAIINPPQCAILAIGKAKPRCIVLGDSRTGIATVARLTLSVDHRAVDGVIAAKFLSALKARIESPTDTDWTRSADETSG